MTREEKAIRLAEKFVKDLSKTLFAPEENAEEFCGHCGGSCCKKCQKNSKKYGLM
jgi:hypothetical protein